MLAPKSWRNSRWQMGSSRDCGWLIRQWWETKHNSFKQIDGKIKKQNKKDQQCNNDCIPTQNQKHSYICKYICIYIYIYQKNKYIYIYKTISTFQSSPWPLAPFFPHHLSCCSSFLDQDRAMSFKLLFTFWSCGWNTTWKGDTFYSIAN